jgi:hypothetical protein
MMLGILVSSVNKKVLSINTTGTGYFSETTAEGKADDNAKKGNKENILLAKNRPMTFGDNTLKATFKGAEEIAPVEAVAEEEIPAATEIEEEIPAAIES